MRSNALSKMQNAAKESEDSNQDDQAHPGKRASGFCGSKLGGG